jgi:FKBP-type peptidyl-prolyl cis-trans isomerase FklB
MRFIYSMLFVSIMGLSVQAQKTTIDSVSYALGILVSKNLKNSGFETISSDEFARAVKESFANTAKMTEEDAGKLYGAYTAAVAKKKGAANGEVGKKFLAENAKKKGITTTASGLQYEVLIPGSGAKPKLTDEVTVHYHGTLLNGKVFDSSVDRKEPATFPLNGVIQGWQEGVQLMPTGAKYKFYIPSNLAYGERGAGGDIGPDSALIFEVELISIKAK